MGLRAGRKDGAVNAADARASTAPAPGGKKWVAKSSSPSTLLRQPSSVAQSARADGAASGDDNRPHTCPVPTLTPQFHWNLNASALKSLNRKQVGLLYGLFKFYDSSTVGDALPSINCARLLEILRDARLLHDGHGNSLPPKGLSVEAVERIFAQAVMGKMRVYLDADHQPALTFPLFCGALMNCAMLLSPTMHPEPALRQILPLLFDGPVSGGSRLSTAKGLLQHLPSDGSVALWMPRQAHGPQQIALDPLHDFRDLPPFQQVIADCARDKALEELKQEKLTRMYQVPPGLAANFHRETLALVTTKFRLFDAFDRGSLPRHELFPLLSSIGKRADLPDPYAVVATLSAGNNGTSGVPNVEASAGELTLAQLLQAIDATREAKRQSISARLAAMRVPPTRQDAAPTSGSNDASLPNHGHVTPTTAENTESESSTHREGTRKGSAHHIGHGHSNRTAKDRVKKTAVHRTRSRGSILSTGSNVPAGTSTHSLLNSKHHSGSRTHLAHHASMSGKKKSELYRKPSSKVNKKSSMSEWNGHHEVDIDSIADSHTQRSGTASSVSDDDHTIGAINSLSSRSEALTSDSVEPVTEPNQDSLPHNGITVQLHDPPRANNSRTVRVFLLLGGDHDGAICCTIALVYATREIVEIDGIYYSTTPSETTRTTPVLPTQKTLKNALLMLKKRVLLKQQRGFELRPPDQLEAVDKMLCELEQREPHFSSPVKQAGKMRQSASVSTLPAAVQDEPKWSASTLSDRPSSSKSAAQQVASPTSGTINALKIPRADSSATPGVMESSPSRKKVLNHFSMCHQHQFSLPSNYRELVASWEISQEENFAWIHDVNAASPLKPASPQRKPQTPPVSRGGPLSPLRLPAHQQDTFDH